MKDCIKKKKKHASSNPKLRCNIQSDSRKLLSGLSRLRKTGDKTGFALILNVKDMLRNKFFTANFRESQCTVQPAKSDSDAMSSLQNYQGRTIDRSPVY